jgi:hypothetical protein
LAKFLLNKDKNTRTLEPWSFGTLKLGKFKNEGKMRRPQI